MRLPPARSKMAAPSRDRDFRLTTYCSRLEIVTESERNYRPGTLATTFSMKTRTRIGTWNVLTLAQQGKLEQLAREASRLKLEILGLSEIRWPNTGEHKTQSGQVLLYSGIRGEHAARERGVGFLLSPQAYAALIRWEPTNERIIVTRFRTRVRNLVQCYAPTNVADLQEKEQFYSQLNSVVERIQKGDIQIHLGDFNAKIGSDNQDLERIMGRHGLGQMSENGELFVEFCGNNNMVIGGSLFPHPPLS
ncbi:craniofacial development protein 2-like [Uranotaenia lowii]|uniref:craniofacial development protein 2-like n=1 Tax=Uranotaenia lowii TaxID=190385 RepID=UPI0024793557|nr:craniofacial development protein 2-like [Uranotaenia lowii]